LSFWDRIPRAALADSLARGYQLITPSGGFDSAATPDFLEVKANFFKECGYSFSGTALILPVDRSSLRYDPARGRRKALRNVIAEVIKVKKK
jgi:hypothetical protein